MKKTCPLFIDDNPVGLQAVVDFDPSVIMFLFNLYKGSEKIQAGQGRLPSLKSKGCHTGHLVQRFFHQNIQCLFGHHPIGSFAAVIHFIRIKTVTAAEITAPGSRFDQ